ncbi:HAMP domain-containing protein [Caulobacter segnis]|uniref:histidine kinase n=2 Tax=Caulobacter segnis TaxID=88688 RepID=D5VEA8_CAUST|nr:HAMP domain-containing sensor histidine kinase [Caulobacter segnis]ADG08931.1 integral membrane sensor signal transduction histidine kinase [Caulobacter segnis ATCC 21756]AVQ00766.1 HAMP domain-containing protein [Caulobacter segnis]
MSFAKAFRRLSPPLWVQMLAVVVVAIVAAHIVTLVLTVFFPPAPPRQYSLSDIGAALRGQSTRHDQERPLVLTLEAAPPSVESPGWVVAPSATRDLAKLLDAPETDVRLLFYAPPPLAGPPIPPPPRHEASRSYVLAGMAPPGPRLMRPGSGRPFPAPGAFPGAARAGAFPPAAMRDSRFGGGPLGGGAPAGGFASRPGGFGSSRPTPPTDRSRPPAALASGARLLAGAMAPGVNGPPRIGPTPDGGLRPPRGPIIRTPLDAAVFGVRFQVQAPTPAETPRPVQSQPEPVAPVVATPVRTGPPASVPAPVERVAAPDVERVSPAPRLQIAKPAPAAPPDAQSGRTLTAPVTSFGFARSSYVEGEFVAAVKRADGRWATVRPQPEGFPNSWQRRIFLWFGLSVALITPIALLVAWRLAAPLKAFAESADRLGREPSADLPPLTGPAEIGVAAEAFNQMQRRIKRYVEDRTGMVRAISHDLRTPLARMRFKLERAPPSLRAAIGRDMDQMEQMIASVLSFMRDEMEGDARQVVDLRSLLEVVVDDATGPAKLEPGPAVLVEIDVVAIQRVMENLIDNAVKYGFEARLKLETIAGEACVTVSDSGPGIPPEELEDVFKAYHRGAQARASGKSGVGLGLVVSRSTVRAHGGELTLRPGSPGLVAEVRLPGARTVEAAA